MHVTICNIVFINNIYSIGMLELVIILFSFFFSTGSDIFE